MGHAAPTEDREVRVSTLELFFDLVFVFTLTQLTGLLADDPSWTGLAKVVLLLSIIWWIYDGYVWLTNTVALDVVGHRLLLLGGMAGFLVMALAIPTTFDDGGLASAWATSQSSRSTAGSTSARPLRRKPKRYAGSSPTTWPPRSCSSPAGS